MEKIEVRQVSQAEAAAHLYAAGITSPDGRATPYSIATSGQCFELVHGDHAGVFVVEQQGARLWISGAGAVASKGLAGVGLQVIEQIARQCRCQRVGFQTGRPGLVRIAQRQGFRIVQPIKRDRQTAGVIMEKSL